MSRLEKGSMEKVRQYCTENDVPPQWTMSLTKGEVRARRFVFLRRQAYGYRVFNKTHHLVRHLFLPSSSSSFFPSRVRFPVEETRSTDSARVRFLQKKCLVSLNFD